MQSNIKLKARDKSQGNNSVFGTLKSMNECTFLIGSNYRFPEVWSLFLLSIIWVDRVEKPKVKLYKSYQDTKWNSIKNLKFSKTIHSIKLVQAIVDAKNGKGTTSINRSDSQVISTPQ